jgi:hypothetical protein
VHPDTFEINRERAIDYLNTRDDVYVFDGYAGVRPSQIPSLTDSPTHSLLSVGPQVPDQGPRDLRPGVPRPLYAQHAYPAD